MNNDRIMQYMQERTAISNLEKAYSMKKHKRMKMLSISMVLMLFLVGGLVTVNAATNGSITNAVKQTIAGWTRTETKTDEGHWTRYEYTKDGTTLIVEAPANMDENTLTDKLNAANFNDIDPNVSNTWIMKLP